MRESNLDTKSGKFPLRSFLKILASGVGGAIVGTVVGGESKKIWEILGKNKAFEMASKICGSIVESEIRGDMAGELIARKAALTWLLAETAMIVAPYVGYEPPSRALRHYLYGDGEPMDMSVDLRHLSSDVSFWGHIFAKGFEHIVESDLGDTSADIKSKRNATLQYFISKLEKGVKFQAQIPREGRSEELGIFYSLGTSEYRLTADKSEVLEKDDQSAVLGVENARLTMQDTYDWVPGDFNPGLVYLSRMTGLVINEAYNSLDLDGFVGKVLENSGVPEWQRQLLYENYLVDKGRLSSHTSSLMVEAAQRLEEAVLGEEATGHYDFDLSLLLDYGAHSFPMSAIIDFKGEK